MIQKKGYSTYLRDWRVKRHAERHVRRGVEPLQHVVAEKILGPAPDLATHEEYVRLQLEAQPDTRVEQWKEELGTAEQSLAQHPSRHLLRPAIAAFGIAEAFGLNDLLRTQGIENPTRLILAIAGTCVLFFLTKKVAETIT